VHEGVLVRRDKREASVPHELVTRKAAARHQRKHDKDEANYAPTDEGAPTRSRWSDSTIEALHAHLPI
jgi:hypothetical protein